jgi:hypothetical protein
VVVFSLREGKVKALIASVALLVASILTGLADEGWKLVGQHGAVNFVVIDSSRIDERAVYQAASADLCRDRPICQVIFWGAGSDAPKSLPMTDQQADAQLAVWNINSNTGLKQMLWSCKRFPSTPKTECF